MAARPPDAGAFTSPDLSSSTPKSVPTNTTMTYAEIRAQIENLPQELYDEIYNLTFTSTHGTVSVVPKSLAFPKFTPPMPRNLLQVPHSTRETFAKAYYGNNTFVIRNKDLLGSWVLTTLSKKFQVSHLTLIRSIRVQERYVVHLSPDLMRWRFETLMKLAGMEDAHVELDYIVD